MATRGRPASYSQRPIYMHRHASVIDASQGQFDSLNAPGRPGSRPVLSYLRMVGGFQLIFASGQPASQPVSYSSLVSRPCRLRLRRTGPTALRPDPLHHLPCHLHTQMAIQEWIATTTCIARTRITHHPCRWQQQLLLLLGLVRRPPVLCCSRVDLRYWGR